MGGSQAVTSNQKPATDLGNQMAGYAGAQSDPKVQGILSQYSSGSLNLSDALAALKQTGSVGRDGSNAAAEGAVSALYSNPETSGLVAQQQVNSNPVYSGLFGKTGQLGQAESNYTNATSNLASDRDALSGGDPSYGLQSSDLAAYGQASNALGKQFSAQNQGLSQQLAARGLASGSNGATASAFAGQYGNQAEQLAGLQQQISQNRISTAQGLAQARNSSDLAQQQGAGQLSTQLGALGNQAYQGQLGANMAGTENTYNTLAGGNAAALNQQVQQQNMNNEAYKQQQSSNFGNQLAGALSGGLSSAVGAFAGGGGKAASDAVFGK